MYQPPHFAVTDSETLHQLIRAYPLGALITHGEGGLDANHLPFELDSGEGAHGVLRAHVARNNPLWQEVKDGDEVLVIFRAADGYISPSWYPSKHEHHQQVPTWNYSVVHAHGRIQIRDDARFVRRLLANLTRHHEAGETTPWKMADAPRGYLEAKVAAVVGIEIEIAELVGKFKLSQNKEAADRLGAANTLLDRGQTALAEAMLSPPCSLP
ncbi:FMN-binding negative transcriptional regulator [Aeromonas hydrophila]|uniref:Transcriptional regulator n=1 Tax=Aeromonas hydrophila TaxID=644 RepID=A0ABD7G6M1_AERHY|nr:FMN-binding negative transcriptional regulator [Aeromonas hydrophila]MBC8672453.1 FMN-binding negative transcriptional regulator [Aeromonas hydrophila]MBC8688336.1 FMN-binding negative transcriptional regulator [Aeromonas hydrophila]RCF48543.1 transcriptional regulator [Aeromonas hydrophila]